MLDEEKVWADLKEALRAYFNPPKEEQLRRMFSQQASSMGESNPWDKKDFQWAEYPEGTVYFARGTTYCQGGGGDGGCGDRIQNELFVYFEFEHYRCSKCEPTIIKKHQQFRAVNNA